MKVLWRYYEYNASLSHKHQFFMTSKISSLYVTQSMIMIKHNNGQCKSSIWRTSSINPGLAPEILFRFWFKSISCLIFCHYLTNTWRVKYFKFPFSTSLEVLYDTPNPASLAYCVQFALTSSAEFDIIPSFQPLVLKQFYFHLKSVWFQASFFIFFSIFNFCSFSSLSITISLSEDI